jgi:hypothetical protein
MSFAMMSEIQGFRRRPTAIRRREAPLIFQLNSDPEGEIRRFQNHIRGIKIAATEAEIANAMRELPMANLATFSCHS